jgi:hypothetical protein
MTIKDGAAATTAPSARFVSEVGGCFGHGASDGTKLEARGTPDECHQSHRLSHATSAFNIQS